MERHTIGKLSSPTEQGVSKKGSDAFLESMAKKMGMVPTSGLRTDADVAKGIGYSGDDHHKGIAEDFAPPSNIANTPKGIAMMDEFAKQAVASGKYNKVIYKGKNLITGTPVAGHFDHVHVSWG